MLCFLYFYNYFLHTSLSSTISELILLHHPILKKPPVQLALAAMLLLQSHVSLPCIEAGGTICSLTNSATPANSIFTSQSVTNQPAFQLPLKHLCIHSSILARVLNGYLKFQTPCQPLTIALVPFSQTPLPCSRHHLPSTSSPDLCFWIPSQCPVFPLPFRPSLKKIIKFLNIVGFLHLAKYLPLREIYNFFSEYFQ